MDPKEEALTAATQTKQANTTPDVNTPTPDNDCDTEWAMDMVYEEVQQKAQHRKKCAGRTCCALCICFIIFAVSFAIYWSQTGGCGHGKNGYPLCGDESIMDSKEHGSCVAEVQDPLRWGCDRDTADRICCYNRKYAEYSGYWQGTTFLDDIDRNNVTTFYDSVTGKKLFVAPIGRSWDEWETESKKHGWPSFRDDEVVWDNVRCLGDGECVSLDGTHLGHNLPDTSGNRYCINLVSIAGYPVD